MPPTTRSTWHQCPLPPHAGHLAPRAEPLSSRRARVSPHLARIIVSCLAPRAEPVHRAARGTIPRAARGTSPSIQEGDVDIALCAPGPPSRGTRPSEGRAYLFGNLRSGAPGCREHVRIYHRVHGYPVAVFVGAVLTQPELPAGLRHDREW